MGQRSYPVAWVSFAARSSDPTDFTLKEKDLSLGDFSKVFLQIFIPNNRPSVHLFHCVLVFHQLPDNNMRTQLDQIDKNENVQIQAADLRPTFFPWDPISPCGRKDHDSQVPVDTSTAASQFLPIRAVDLRRCLTHLVSFKTCFSLRRKNEKKSLSAI